jgi:hypothetical protein
MLIEKVEKLWMVIHQIVVFLLHGRFLLGFARRVVMQMARKQMSWALYAKWTN